MDVFPPPLFDEGLFLRPHHLQLEQRHREAMAAVERSLFHPHPFGVFAFEPDEDLLRAPPQQRALRFHRLYAIMPSSGRVIMIDRGGGNTALDPLLLPDSLGPYDGVLQVWLAIPSWNPARPNTLEAGSGRDAESPRLYEIFPHELNDENTGANRQPIYLRKTRAFLLMGREDNPPCGDIEILPLARIIDDPHEERRGELILDPEYSGPALILSAIPEIMRQWDLFTRYVMGQRQAAENRVRPRFSLEGMTFSGWRQVEKLQLLNSTVPRLRSLAAAGKGVSTWRAWMELAEIHGRLSGLYPDHLQWETPEFNANNPLSSLRWLMRRIRSLLDAEGAPQFQKFEFHADAEGTLRCRLPVDGENALFAVGRQFFLAVSGETTDVDGLRTEISTPARFKIIAGSDVERAVFGIPLAYESFPPEDIPQSRNTLLFHMQRDSKSALLWEKITQEREIAISSASMHNVKTYCTASPGFSLFIVSPPK